MRPELLQAVLPYVTVHSRTLGVDPRVAAPALLAELAGFEPAKMTQLVGAARDRARKSTPRGVPSQFLSPSTGRSFLIRAEVRTPAGGLFAQEAIVEMMAGEMPDELREWRRGQGRSFLSDATRLQGTSDFGHRAEPTVPMGRGSNPA